MKRNNVVSLALTGVMVLGSFSAYPAMMLADEAVEAEANEPVGFVQDGFVVPVDENGDVALVAQVIPGDNNPYRVRYVDAYGNAYNGAIGWNTYVTNAVDACWALLDGIEDPAARAIIASAVADIRAYTYLNNYDYAYNCARIDAILSNARSRVSGYRVSGYYGGRYYDVYVEDGYRYNDRYWNRNRNYSYNRYWDRGRDYCCNSSSSSSSKTTTVEKTAVYRLVNSANADHVYTTSTSERDSLVAEGWTSEGTAWKSPKTSGTPVYELVNATNGKHFYTKGASERDSLVQAGWKDEGVAFYADEDKGRAVYRMLNSKNGDHFFTSSTSERDNLLNNGWVNEGTAFYVCK